MVRAVVAPKKAGSDERRSLPSRLQSGRCRSAPRIRPSRVVGDGAIDASGGAISATSARSCSRCLSADFYFPRAPAVHKATVYPPVIRIHSDRKWPERVVFDTMQTPVTVAEPVAANIAIAVIPLTRSNRLLSRRKSLPRAMRSRCCCLRARRPELAYQHKRQRKPQYRVARANRYMKQQMILAMQQKQFAWLDFHNGVDAKAHPHQEFALSIRASPALQAVSPGNS